MSIWVSTYGTDAWDHAFRDDGCTCAKWVPDTCGGEFGACGHGRLLFASRGDGGNDRYRLDGDMPCTCRCGPIRYHGSHVRPTVDDERAGSFGLAHVPGFITAGGYDDAAGETPHEFLRVTTVAEPEDDVRHYWTSRATELLTASLGADTAANAVALLAADGALQGQHTVVDVVLDGNQVDELADYLNRHQQWRDTGELPDRTGVAR